MRTRIQNATIVNEGKRFVGTVTLEDDKILSIVPSDDTIHTLPPTDRVIDAEGLYLIPGVIDDHVHFREPGLTHKADIATESRAAAAGGVTSYIRPPLSKPWTTSSGWQRKRASSTILSSSGPPIRTPACWNNWTRTRYVASNCSWEAARAICSSTAKTRYAPYSAAPPCSS